MSRILIVEDHVDSCDALAHLLRQAGHEVRCASNGIEALSDIVSNTPDLFVLDLHMPEMDGVGLLHIIRSYLRLQALPVVVWTGLPESPLVEKARFLKVNSIVEKGQPSFDDILGAIRKALPAARQ